MSGAWAVSGKPTADELAAAVAVLSAQPAVVEEEPQPVASRWNARADLLRRPLPHGPGAWGAGLR